MKARGRVFKVRMSQLEYERFSKNARAHGGRSAFARKVLCGGAAISKRDTSLLRIEQLAERIAQQFALGLHLLGKMHFVIDRDFSPTQKEMIFEALVSAGSAADEAKDLVAKMRRR